MRSFEDGVLFSCSLRNFKKTFNFFFKKAKNIMQAKNRVQYYDLEMIWVFIVDLCSRLRNLGFWTGLNWASEFSFSVAFFCFWLEVKNNRLSFWIERWPAWRSGQSSKWGVWLGKGKYPRKKDKVKRKGIYNFPCTLAPPRVMADHGLKI